MRGVPAKAGQSNESLLGGDMDPWLPRFKSSCMKYLPLAGKVFDLTHEEYANGLSAAATPLDCPFECHRTNSATADPPMTSFTSTGTSQKFMPVACGANQPL